jgi:hypothetical protein
MKKVDKEYPQPFLLEPTKLNRIVDTIHASFAGIPNATLHDNFEVFLTGDRREELPSVLWTPCLHWTILANTKSSAW